jgi:antitoxin Phd
MNIWPVQDAEARFDELLDVCVSNGPQILTRSGEEVAVLLPIEEWRHLQASARPSIKALLLAEEGRTDALVPARRATRQRNAPAAE